MSNKVTNSENKQESARRDTRSGDLPSLEIARGGSCANNCQGCRCKPLSQKPRE